jgi:RNA polymerase sigma-70 factor (ECF subfamily)
MSTSKFQLADGLSLPANLPAADSRAISSHQAEVLALFDECGPGLRRYVRSFGLPPEAGEDVLQEVFLSLFCHLELERPRTNLRGWLFQAGHHLALKQRARLAAQWRRESTLDTAAADSVIDPADDAEQRLVYDARSKRLRSVLRALPERDRQCVYLRAEGLRYRQIASALQISLGTVAKSIARAVTRLQLADAGEIHAGR